MALFYKVNNTWKKCDIHYKNTSGWKEVKNIFHKVGTTWKPIWNYFWETSNWSACNVTCGGGTQTRTTKCKRSDGFYKADSFCLSEGLNKPITEQACNTQACYSLVTKVCGGSTGGATYTWTWSGVISVFPTDYRTYSVYVLTNVGCDQCGSRQSRFKDGWFKLRSPVLSNPQTITWTFAYGGGACLGGNYPSGGTRVYSGCQGAKCQDGHRCGPNNLDASCYAHRRYIGNYSHEPNKPLTYLTYIVQSYANYHDHERVLNNIRFEFV